MKKYLAVVTILALTAVLVAGCEGVPPASSLPAGMGMLEVRVTDPPAPPMEEIWVEVKNLEVHKAGGPWTTIVVDSEPFNLKELVGIHEFLANHVVEAGRYTQLRLDVHSVTIVVVEEEVEEEYDAKVPSDKIKLVGTFEVVENQTTVITLDFNGEESVLVTGAGEYIFKPVIKLLVSQELVITTTILPGGEEGLEYTAIVEAIGGKKPYTWIKSEGNLPTGLTLDDGTGIISGEPTEEGVYDFTVQVTDSSDPQQSDTQALSIDIES